MDAKGVLTEAFGRLPELVETAVRGLTPEQLRWQPAAGANSIGWLVWHLTRVQDDHVAEVMGTEQVYAGGDWAARFGLKDPSETGYGHDASQITAVAPESTAPTTSPTGEPTETPTQTTEPADPQQTGGTDPGTTPTDTPTEGDTQQGGGQQGRGGEQPQDGAGAPPTDGAE